MSTRIIGCLLIIVFAVSKPGLSAGNDLPKSLKSCLARTGEQIDRTLNPYYLVGNFYGDGRPSEQC